jgi:hypothetical protein
MTNFLTNLFNHQKTYIKPKKPTKPLLTLEWNEAYQNYLTQLIKAIEDQMATRQQIKKLLELSFYLDKALNHD